ncbi:DUF397 domain-containing protein [Streptomyces sp. NPDC058266]|uniref:DUF397 domain-containing protein n=1 Tax=Streptomyces sp. NPDC058266 TaxID=3346412 RepID=UPI0036E632FA
MSTGLEWFKSSYSGSDGGDCLEAAYEWRKSSYSGSDGGNCLEAAYGWSKSTYSSEQGGACLEVARDWSKSTYSGSEGGDCLEVSPSPAAIHIRDSKNVTAAGDGPMFTVTPEAWAAFLPLARRSR